MAKDINKVIALALKGSEEFAKTSASAKHRGLKVDISKIDHAWEQQRAAMMRLALLVMRDNDRQAYERFSKDEQSIEAGVALLETLSDEIVYLKEGLKLMDGAVARLITSISRHHLARIPGDSRKPIRTGEATVKS
jgi:hypothetical protein